MLGVDKYRLGNGQLKMPFAFSVSLTSGCSVCLLHEISTESFKQELVVKAQELVVKARVKPQ